MVACQTTASYYFGDQGTSGEGVRCGHEDGQLTLMLSSIYFCIVNTLVLFEKLDKNDTIRGRGKGIPF